MRESPALRFLYHTSAGRIVLKQLIKPSVSRAAARYFSSPLSRWLIRYYVRKYQIDLTGCDKRYASFNDFFMRRKSVQIGTGEGMISPCDGYLSAYTIDHTLRTQIKGSTYSISDLLQDGTLADAFEGGLCCIFRLEPQHYHHYVFVDGGEILAVKRIPGVLHCVRPIACDAFPVYIQNSREYVLLRSRTYGQIVQMEIGALLVGKISNDPLSGDPVKGMEKGHFEYGGSTIVLLFQQNAVQLLPLFAQHLDTGREQTVSIGEIIGEGFTPLSTDDD